MPLPATVAALWRYPVKSMLGERCQSLALTARGVEGDRLYAIRDADGKFGSGKSTRRFRRIDGLFAFHAVYGSIYTTVGSWGCVNLRLADARHPAIKRSRPSSRLCPARHVRAASVLTSLVR